MNQPLAVTLRDGKLTLVFLDMSSADAFLRAQSPDLLWRKHWTLRYNSVGTVNAEVSDEIVIDLRKSPSV